MSNSEALSDWPAVAIGPDGSVYAVWAEGPIGSREIYYATNSGGEWSPPTNVSGSSTVESYAPDVAVDSEDGANIVWQEGTDGDPSIEVMYVRCVGTACDAVPVKVSTGKCQYWASNWPARMPSIVVGDDGMAMLTWLSQEAGGNYLPSVVWQPPNPVPTQVTACTPYSGYIWMPDLAAGPSGERRLVFENYQSGTISHGRYASDVWSPPRSVGTGNTPRVVADAEARSHILWCSEGTVKYLYGDGVTAWSALEVVAADQQCGGPPTVAIRWDGLVQAIWESWANGVQVVQSIRRETGWTPAEDVSLSAANGEDPALVADAQGDLHLLWADSRGGDFDILYSSLSSVTYPHTVIVEGPGFDRCDAPPVDKLQVWRDSSPYRFVGIYYGGNNRVCLPQPELEPADTKGREWVGQVTAMGWKILPIWAGPSPRCRARPNPYRAYIALDAEAARVQGGEEAQAATDKARELGLAGEDGSGTVIYYDMEPFGGLLDFEGREDDCPNAGYQAQAIAAASAFVEGWSARLRALGNMPGVYGLARNLAPWFGLPDQPEAVWLAHYRYEKYEASVTVWDIEGIPNSSWDSHQRIFQYTNTHSEPHGGIAWSICSSVADGPLAIGAGPSMAGPARAPSVSPAPATPPGLGSLDVEAMDLLSPSEGWVLAGGNLLWSHDGGEAWEDVTPPEAEDEVVLAVEFVDPLHGWVMSALPSESYVTVELSLSRTSDGGQTWETTVFRTYDEFAFPQSVYLEFVDPDTGWAVVRMGSSSNSSDGQIFATTDGGLDWSEVGAPSGNPVRFLTADHGWSLSGPGRHELLETLNGGLSWTPVSLDLPPPLEPRNEIYGLPVFENESLGLLPIVLSDLAGSQIWFYVTDDGGSSWFPEQVVSIVDHVDRSSVFPIEIIDTQHWVLPYTGGLSGLAGPVMDLAFASPEVGWATIGGSTCTQGGDLVPCTLLSGLYGTTDGGDSWQPVLLPAAVLYLPLVLR